MEHQRSKVQAVIDLLYEKCLQEILHTVNAGEEGLYALIFVRCQPSSASVSFKIHAKFYNPGPNYLSAGEAALPSIFFAFFFIYSVVMAFWVYVLRRRREKVDSVVYVYCLRF